jgi:deoxyribodipyrimidine photolyase-related protein
MDGDDPQGGQWNFDKDNRRKLPKDIELPQRLSFEPDSITQEVLDLVDARFDGNFGDLEPFTMPVTRARRWKLLDHFIDRLPAQFWRLSGRDGAGGGVSVSLHCCRRR